MHWILAVVFDGTIYNLHEKIYLNKKQAQNALEKMKSNGKLSKQFEVWEVKSWNLKQGVK